MTLTWGTPGANAPSWGNTVKLHVWLALGRGNTFALGPSPFDRLDAGNVIGQLPNPQPAPDAVITGFPFTLGPMPHDTLDDHNYLSWHVLPGEARGPTERLWVDVSCDVIDLNIHSGATTDDGVLAKAQAGTCSIVIADPDQDFDPINGQSKWQFQGHTRLTPGVPVIVWADVLQDGLFVLRRTLFVGKALSFSEPWVRDPADRRCTIEAADVIADLANRDHAALGTPVGAGEFVHQRLERILNAADGPPLQVAGDSLVPLQATDLEGNAWQLINAAADDEIGFVGAVPYAPDPLGFLFRTEHQALRFLPRSTWFAQPAPVMTVPCEMMTDATVSALDLQIRNRVTAARTGGTAVTVRSEQSIDRFGEHSYSKTDLGLEGDDDAGQWAAVVLALFAFPQARLQDVTIVPGARPDLWWQVLSVRLAMDRVVVQWTPPGGTATYITTARVIGVDHQINYERWTIQWTLGTAENSGRFFTLGPGDRDQLDHANVLSFPHESIVTAFDI